MAEAGDQTFLYRNRPAGRYIVDIGVASPTSQVAQVMGPEAIAFGLVLHLDDATQIITGGPCASGEPGATAYRIRFDGNYNGDTARVIYEVNGLPDQSRDRAGAYGSSFSYMPKFVGTFLGDGGLELASTSFIDIELSTAGVTGIENATLSLYGRSLDTGSGGSFRWQTFTGVGATPTDFVSNMAPYEWYPAEVTSAIAADDDRVLLRIKAGPPSGKLVVNQVELCMQAY